MQPHTSGRWKHNRRRCARGAPAPPRSANPQGGAAARREATAPVEIMHHVDDTPYGADSKESSTKTTTNYHIEVGAIVIENSPVFEKEDGHTQRKRDNKPKHYS